MEIPGIRTYLLRHSGRNLPNLDQVPLKITFDVFFGTAPKHCTTVCSRDQASLSQALFLPPDPLRDNEFFDFRAPLVGVNNLALPLKLSTTAVKYAV